ncbi:hypothetical protein ACRAWD_29875 [Caulobacter segnis]
MLNRGEGAFGPEVRARVLEIVDRLQHGRTSRREPCLAGATT